MKLNEKEKLLLEIIEALVKNSKNKKANWMDITYIAQQEGIDYGESTKIIDKLQKTGHLIDVSTLMYTTTCLSKKIS